MKINLSLKSIFVVCCFSFFQHLNGQTIKPIKFNLDERGEHYLRFTLLNQTWVRYTVANPGSTVNGDQTPEIFDIGLRRTRMQIYGKVLPRTFVYAQFGMNNFNYNSQQFQGAFFHDALCEIEIFPKYLSIGSGLTGWTGISRFASPSVSSFLTMDAPIYQQATNGTTDQFLRKLSIYAKGKIGKIDYRMAISKPMNILKSPNPLTSVFSTNFSSDPPKLQTHAYVMYQFFDQEENTTPYTTGSYLGTKKILNVGVGYLFQPDALEMTDVGPNPTKFNMLLATADLFADIPLNTEKQNAITFYGAFSYTDFGYNYIRNVGVMNPATGLIGSSLNTTINGSGNSFAMLGSGATIYFQAGYKLKNNLIGKSTFQFYAASQISNFKAITKPVEMYEFGFNYFVHGTHQSKISLNCQLRELVQYNSLGYSGAGFKPMWVLQYQIAI